jgi:hypothetical protein
MTQRSKLLLALITIAIPVLPREGAAQETTQEEFESVLQQASMRFTLPKDFTVVPAVDNPDVLYQYAISAASVKLEIRYQIRPLASDVEEFQRNGGKGADPNTLYRALLLAMCLNLSGGAICNPSAFRPEDVRKEFGADAGMTAFVKLDSDFGKGYKVCLVNVIHVQNKGDAFTFFLFDDLPSVQSTCFRDDVFHALKFK